ncbi:MAG: asparagine synthase (glutamine-hydrolyzing), partial [Thermodesulfobacteriota bacterium]
MCGIAGIISFSDRGEQECLERMCNTMSHRGPDDSGIYHSPDSRALLGHRRLSIIDLSRSARQPLSNEDDTVLVTCNGEIYNYQELRKELDARGHRFKSKCDTEVIVHGYEEWGIEGLLQRLRGMFAFGLYDTRPEGASHPTLFLARDRLGIKPLYYYTAQDKRFVFASEINAILASGLAPRETDLQATALYLLHGSIPPPKTIYKGITALEPGHYLALSSATGRPSKERYYHLEEAFEDGSLSEFSEEESTQRVRSCLLDTIRCHLLSDVPVGAFLSGGIDSTAIVALMRELQYEQLKTVSIIFPGTPYD